MLFIILKNTVEPDRPLMTFWRVRVACWIPKATSNTPGICNACYFSTAAVIVGARLSAKLHIYYLSCFFHPNWTVTYVVVINALGNSAALPRSQPFIASMKILIFAECCISCNFLTIVVRECSV